MTVNLKNLLRELEIRLLNLRKYSIALKKKSLLSEDSRRGVRGRKRMRLFLIKAS